MNEFGSQIIYKQLLERHGRVRIPMIQRDYAQGRPAEAEVRKEFLVALEGALRTSSRRFVITAQSRLHLRQRRRAK